MSVSETLQSIQSIQYLFKKCHESSLFPLPVTLLLSSDSPTERERTERLIKTKLREIMMQKDLENITSKEVSGEGAALEVLSCKLEISLLYAMKKGQNKNFTWLPCVPPSHPDTH